MKCPELELWGSKLEMWNSPGTAAFRLDNSSDSVVLPVGIPILNFSVHRPGVFEGKTGNHELNSTFFLIFSVFFLIFFR